MSVFVRHADTLKGAWPRAKTTAGWRTPSRVFAKKDDAWWEIARNSIKVVLGDPEGAETIIHNFNLKDWLVTNGWWSTSMKLRVDVTVLPNTYLTSPFMGMLEARNPKAAFSTGAGWAIGSVVKLTNYGWILGAAGLPGRPQLIVPVSDPQNIEQAYELETRCTKKLNMRTVLNYMTGYRNSQGGGRDTYRRNFVDVTGGVTDATGEEVGGPTDGGDAIENFTTMVIYNYGKIYGGGGGGGSFPHIMVAVYIGTNMINYNIMGGDTAIRTIKGAAEQSPIIGGFGAGDLRQVAETQPGKVSRGVRVPASSVLAPVVPLTNYGKTYTGGTDSDKWGTNGRLSVTAPYSGGSTSFSIVSYCVQAAARSLSGMLRVAHTTSVKKNSPEVLKGAPSSAEYTLQVAAAGGYSSAYGTFGHSGVSFWREYGALNVGSEGEKFQVSGGEGGDWGQDGFYSFVSYSEHDTESYANFFHVDMETWEPKEAPASHYLIRRRIYLDVDGAVTREGGDAIINEAPPALPNTFSGGSAMVFLLRKMGAELSMPQTNMSNPTAYPIDSELAGELMQLNNRFNRMMKPGKGGRAVKGAAAVVFATPNNDGSYKGRIE